MPANKEVVKKVLDEVWSFKPGTTSGREEILLTINGEGYALKFPVNGLDGKAEERVRQMILGHKLLQRLSKLTSIDKVDIVCKFIRELGA